ncbi:hypothetical protein QQ054_09945 [Oscillatoria amoena NRMC-F 0135]|nr:hypothetical protein [Oscillatoria amoena NRMC-F 0135]
MEIELSNNKSVFYGRLIVILLIVRIATFKIDVSLEVILYLTVLLLIIISGIKKNLCKIILTDYTLELVYKNIYSSSVKKFKRSELVTTLEKGTKMRNGKKEQLVIKANGEIVDVVHVSYFKKSEFEQLLNLS